MAILLDTQIPKPGAMSIASVPVWEQTPGAMHDASACDRTFDATLRSANPHALVEFRVR